MRTFGLFPSLAIVMVLCACDSQDFETSFSQTLEIEQDALTQPCSLVMGWDPWEPYQYQVSREVVLGLDVDLLSAILANVNCEIRFKRGSWMELLSLMKAGQIDVLAGATHTSGRQQFAFFTDVYRDEQFYLYVATDRLDKLNDKNFDQLIEEGFRVGVIEGYLYTDTVTNAQNDPSHEDQFTYSSMNETSISLLLDGNVDGIIEDKYVGAAIVRRKNLAGRISPHAINFDTTGVRFMISRASVDELLYQRINQSLGELLANGEIEQVLEHYLDP